MAEVTYVGFVIKALRMWKESDGVLRKGQCYYSTFHDLHPHIATAIAGDKDLDPFYKDENITNFCVYVIKTVWNSNVFKVFDQLPKEPDAFKPTKEALKEEHVFVAETGHGFIFTSPPTLSQILATKKKSQPEPYETGWD